MSVEVPPSKSIILVDSKYGTSIQPMYYDVTEVGTPAEIGYATDPANFECRLNANVTAKSVTYNSLAWSQPVYTHTGESADFRFSVWSGSEWMGPYVMYHKPYHIFRSFAGVDRAVAPGYQEGIAGSYIKDWEYGLNTDIRLASDNTVNVSPIQVGGVDVIWGVQYEASQGIRITASNTADAENANIAWRMEECGSIRVAHHVHGFGVLQDVASGNYVPEWVARGVSSSSEASGKNIHISDFPPSLIPIINLDVYCPQITRDRRLQTFRNAEVGKALGNEVANFSLWHGNSCVFRTYQATREENVWNVRLGTEPDVVNMILANSETGRPLRSSTCFANMLNGFYPSRALLYQQWFLESTNYRGDADAMNALLFNIDAPLSGEVVPITSAYGNPNAELLLDEVIHIMDVYLPE